MSKPTDIQLKSVRSDTQEINYRTPIKFGGRVVDDVVLLNITVDVETRDGRSAQDEIEIARVGEGAVGVNVSGLPAAHFENARNLRQ